jgi:hypothetical protein
MDTICIVKGCGHKAAMRGVCKSCAEAAYRAIRGGQVTDAQLVKAGLLLPKRRGPATAMLAAIREVKKTTKRKSKT